MSCPSAPQKKSQKMSKLILGSRYLSATPSSFRRPERPGPICLSCFQHRLSQTRPWSDKIRSWCCCSWASQSPGIRYKICKQLEIYKFNGFTTNLLSPAFVKVLIIDSCTSKSQRSTLPFLSPSFTFTWDVRSLFNQVPFGRKMLGTFFPPSSRLAHEFHHFTFHRQHCLYNLIVSIEADFVDPCQTDFSLDGKKRKKSSRILLAVVNISKSIALPSPNQITPPFTESFL